MFFKTRILVLAAMAWLPLTAAAEEVSGRLDAVDFNHNMIEVNGTVYEIEAEAAEVKYRGETISEGDLQPGDSVRVVFEEPQNGRKRLKLMRVILLSSRREGLQS